MKKIVRDIYFLLLVFLLINSCSNPELENPFDPESSFNTAPMQGELILIQLSDSKIKLDWQLNSTIVGNYIIKRKINSGDYEILTTVNSSTNNFTDTELLTTNIYCYQLIGANGEIQTDPISNSFSTTFSEITNLNIQQENLYTAKLTWQHNCNYEIGYIIERQEISSKENFLSKEDTKARKVSNINRSTQNNNRSSSDFIQIANLSANTFEYIDDTLLPNHLYEYRIYAYTEYNVSIENIGNINMLVPPTNLTFDQLRIMSIEFNWNDNSNGEDGFKIDKKVGTNIWQLEYETVTENTTTWRDTSAEINEDLQYRVYAYSGTYNSDYDETGVIDNTIPAPENLTFQMENLSYPTANIHLEWDYLFQGIDGFKVIKNGVLLPTTIPASIMEWNDVGVVIGNSYSYQILAFYQSYNSTYSNKVNVDAITCVDIDGNVYETNQIGNQEWMAENLKVTHYRWMLSSLH